MFTMELAGYRFTVDNQFPDVENLCKDYLCADSGIPIKITEEQLRRESTPPHQWSDGYLETLAVYRSVCEHLITKDIMLFHCSALAMDGRAYLFTAPSGTGKSTHAKLWRQHFGNRVITINDDKPLLEFKDQEIIVHGTPYGGKDGLQTNTKEKVAGIVVLAQGKENTIRRLSYAEAFSALIKQSYRPSAPAALLRTLDLVARLAQLPIYRLECTISIDAVELAYQALREEKDNET